MPLALKVTDHWSDQKRVHVIGTLTASGSYPTGGDTVPLTDPLIKSNTSPVWFQAQGQGGYNYVGLPGALNSTPATAKLQAFADAGGTEVPAGAYPAGITSNPIKFYAIFPKFI